MDPITQLELEGLYAESAEALDEGNLDRWTTHFAAETSYRLMTKENVDRGWPLALLSCDNRAMLIDRIVAMRETLYYLPRVQRRIQSGIRAVRTDGADVHVRGSFAVFETFPGKPTTLFAVGRFLDEVRREGEGVKFSNRTLVLDGELIANTLLLL